MTHGRSYWERHARRYDRSTRFLARPVPRMLELCVDHVRGRARVLEVAAGTGLVTAAIAPVVGELVATDYAREMVAQLAARALPNVTCAPADITQLAYADASFDAVVAANVLHLLPDLDAALASLGRVLAPGGILVAPTYLHRETWVARILSRLFALTGFPGARRFTARSLREALERRGFVILQTETIPGPFPVGFVVAGVPDREL